MEVLVCREVDRPDKSAYANVQGVPRAIQLDLVLFSNSTPVNTFRRCASSILVLGYCTVIGCN